MAELACETTGSGQTPASRIGHTDHAIAAQTPEEHHHLGLVKLYWGPLMSSQVVAAIIAASVSVLTLIGTLAAQFFGRRATSRDTERALGRTLAEQRIRTLNERFATAAERLGSDKPPAVQLAGVYAMAGLADDWEENRQTCVDILCGYMRIPYQPDPGNDALAPERLAYRASREVRHTVIRIIAAHLLVVRCGDVLARPEPRLRRRGIRWRRLRWLNILRRKSQLLWRRVLGW